MTDAAQSSAHRTLEVFSAPSDGPRVRWPTDLISAGFSSGALIVLVLIAGNGSTLDTNTLQFIGTLPGWLLWSGQAAYVVGVLYSFGLLIGVGIFAKGRLELLRDLLLAALLAVVIVVVFTRLIDERWPELAFFDLDRTRDTFPAFFVTTSTAIQAAASPWLTAPMRKIGWTAILGAVAAAILGGVTTSSDAAGGVLVGLIAAAIIRYALRTSAGLPSTDSVRAGLAGLGVEVDTLQYYPYDDQPTIAVILSGTSVDGRPLFVEGLGRDSWSTRRWMRWWKAAWYHDDGSQYGSDRRQQIEHESLTVLLAAQHEVPVPTLVGVGMTERNDAVLIVDRYDHRLADLSADDVDDDVLDAIWDALGRLHDAGISHGSLDAVHVWFDASGRPELAGFGNATIRPPDDQLRRDDAALLVVTTLQVGADRAIAAARRTRQDDDLAATLPLLQTAALNARVRHRVKQHKVRLKDLRTQTAEALGVDVPEVEQLTRVTWKNVVMLGFIVFAMYSVIAGLADVGFDTIANTLSDARWSLVLLGLVLAAATNYTDAITVVTVAPKAMPVAVTTVEQFAISFVNTAVPASAGQIATNVRYFQKFGINAVAAALNGVLTGLSGLVAQVVLVGLAVLVGAGSIDLTELQGGGDVIRLLVSAIAVLAGVIAVTLLVPRWRDWARSKLRKPVSQVRDALRAVESPRTLLTALAASIGTQMLFGAAFMVCVLAMGGSITLGQAIFLNITVSLVGAVSPVPNNAGVAEAGLTAGLTAIGVGSGVAVSGVLVYRLVSSYLPPIWGYICLRWLTKHDYL